MPELPTASTAQTMQRLRGADQLLDGIDLSDANPADLPAVTTALRRIEGRCAAVGVAVAARANATGNDPSATLLGRGRVSGRRAHQEAKRAATVERMPQLGNALQSGRVSGEHIDAVTRARAGLTGDEVELFDQLGPDLASAATKLPVDTFNRKLRTLIDDARADHGMTRLKQQRARSSLKMWSDPDGMRHLHVAGDPERFAYIETAIEHQTAALAAAAKHDNQPVTLGPALQFDALVELLSSAQGTAGRPTITILVDQATLTSGPHEHTLCETDSGVELPAPVVDRYLCDATTQHVTLDGAGLPIHVGRKHRTATPTQWTALKALYASCVWQGCDRPITWTQAHHIRYWEHGGPTNLDNLVPLCSRHHHMVHDEDWRLVLRPDRTLEIHHPPPRPAAAQSAPPGHPPPLRAARPGQTPPPPAPIGHSPPRLAPSGHARPPRPGRPDLASPHFAPRGHAPPPTGPDTLWATTQPDRRSPAPRTTRALTGPPKHPLPTLGKTPG